MKSQPVLCLSILSNDFSLRPSILDEGFSCFNMKRAIYLHFYFTEVGTAFAVCTS